MKCRKLERPHMGKLDGVLFYLDNDFSRIKDTSEFDHDLIASSNGLVLSLFYPRNNTLEYCITNPLTEQSVRMPPMFTGEWRWRSGFATRQTEINGSYHVSYRVVLFTTLKSFTSCTVHIFSSDTGCWTSPVSGLRKLLTNSSTGQDFCHNGILYWFDHNTKSIATYDPYDAPNRFGSIRLPNFGSDDVQTQKGISLVHLGQEDTVRYCEIKKQDNISTLFVWRLVEGEWRLQWRCPISPLCSVENWFLSDCRQLVCVDPSKSRAVSYLYTRRSGQFTAIELRSGREKYVKSGREFPTIAPDNVDRRPFVPVVFCPWSSPLYRQLD